MISCCNINYGSGKYSSPVDRRATVIGIPAILQTLSFSRDSKAQQLNQAPGPPPPPNPLSLDQYQNEGPYSAARLPLLEHTCASCFPSCSGNQCLLRIDVIYPRKKITTKLNENFMLNNQSDENYTKKAFNYVQIDNYSNLVINKSPFPLAIITGGFLVSRDEYQSYAERLASWGFVSILYDKLETVTETLDDVASSCFINDLITWAGSDPLLSSITDPSQTYLVGHSRGGKLSILAAVRDPRVFGVCLIDPVDNTKYAPLGPRYPSALESLKNVRTVPMALVGAGLGGDCVPVEANYKQFFKANANKSPTWQIGVKNVGHFQFLDKQTSLQRAICAQGNGSDTAIRDLTQAVMISWGNFLLIQQNNKNSNRNFTSPVSRQFGASEDNQFESVLDKFRGKLDFDQKISLGG